MKNRTPHRCPRCDNGWIINPADHYCEDCLDAIANRAPDAGTTAITTEYARQHGANLDDVNR